MTAEALEHVAESQFTRLGPCWHLLILPELSPEERVRRAEQRLDACAANLAFLLRELHAEAPQSPRIEYLLRLLPPPHGPGEEYDWRTKQPVWGDIDPSVRIRASALFALLTIVDHIAITAYAQRPAATYFEWQDAFRNNVMLERWHPEAPISTVGRCDAIFHNCHEFLSHSASYAAWWEAEFQSQGVTLDTIAGSSAHRLAAIGRVSAHWIGRPTPTDFPWLEDDTDDFQEALDDITALALPTLLAEAWESEALRYYGQPPAHD